MFNIKYESCSCKKKLVAEAGDSSKTQMKGECPP